MGSIREVAVIGAGTMGAGIAAHFSNAGVSVLLLDVAQSSGSRNALAEAAISKLRQSNPPHFMSRQSAALVTPGNIDDDLVRVASCDWIIEAIVENLQVKQSIYRGIDAVRRPGSIVSSSTSTIPLVKLTQGMPASFTRDFAITHFFNPPRYMRLLELVTNSETAPDLIEKVRSFSDVALGKSVVIANDTPGFIANRLGIFWMLASIVAASVAGLAVEEADAVLCRCFGVPRLGVFGLLDLLGLDLMPHVTGSLAASLPANDAFHTVNRSLPVIDRMIENGHIGRKGHGGFYRKGVGGREAIDLSTGEYRPEHKPDLSEVLDHDLRHLLIAPTRAGRFGWTVLGQTLAYAASLVPEAANDIAAVDEAMRLGYNWERGPFDLIDQLGTDWLADKLTADGIHVPPLLASARRKTFYRQTGAKREHLGADGAYTSPLRQNHLVELEDFKRASKPFAVNESAAVWDIGDGVLCFEPTSKDNTWDLPAFEMLNQVVDGLPLTHRALVLYSDRPHFCTRTASNFFIDARASKYQLDNVIAYMQRVLQKVKYASFPSVAASAGMTLGPGCEAILHCSSIQAHAESWIGLTERNFGLIPTLGGCKELLARWMNDQEPSAGGVDRPATPFETICKSAISTSADNARELLFLRKQDRVSMNRYRLLGDAKRKALSMTRGYTPPKPFAIAMDKFSALIRSNDARCDFVAGELASFFPEGEMNSLSELTEQHILDFERATFLQLIDRRRV